MTHRAEDADTNVPWNFCGHVHEKYGEREKTSFVVRDRTRPGIKITPPCLRQRLALADHEQIPGELRILSKLTAGRWPPYRRTMASLAEALVGAD